MSIPSKKPYELLDILLPAIRKDVEKTIDFIQEITPYYHDWKKSEKEEDKLYIADLEKELEKKLHYLITPFTKNEFQKMLYYCGELNPEAEKKYRAIWGKRFK